MRRWAIGISIAVLVLAALAVAAVAWGGVPRATAGASPPQPNIVPAGSEGADAPAEAPSRHLVASAEPSSLDSDGAMDAAAKIIVPGALLRAKNIVISKYRFTSDELDASVVPANALVWIVTLNGIDTPFRGGMNALGTTRKVPVAHQMNVVIDANTGAGLLAFTGSVTR